MISEIIRKQVRLDHDETGPIPQVQEQPRRVSDVLKIQKDRSRWRELSGLESFLIYGRITKIEDYHPYDGCRVDECQGKTLRVGDTQYFKCQICGRSNLQLTRLVLTLWLEDSPSKIKVKMFDDEALKFLGKSSDEIQNYTHGRILFEQYKILSRWRKQDFRVRAKIQMYRGRSYIDFIVEDF